MANRHAAMLRITGHQKFQIKTMQRCSFQAPRPSRGEVMVFCSRSIRDKLLREEVTSLDRVGGGSGRRVVSTILLPDNDIVPGW